MIFLVGWFRSGTSLMWNLLRGTGQYHCYYEPFHELLPQLAYTSCKHEIDPTHRSIDDYWTEYRSVSKTELLTHWAPWYGRSRWRLTEGDTAPDMEAYIRFLAMSSKKTPVFKFVRAAFRTGWLRQRFPQARIIWINRDPRRVWDSMQNRDSETAAEPGHPEITQQGFSNYVIQIAQSLGFPIRDDLYSTFYEMWISSYTEAYKYLDDIWWYDDILEDYPAWARKHLVETGLTPTVPPYEIETTHSQSCYARRISSYLAAETKVPLPCSSENGLIARRILDETASRNEEILDLRARILDLESALCRERERDYLVSGKVTGYLREKAKKNLFKLRRRLTKR